MRHQVSGPRFDRIVPLITLVLTGLGVVFLIELNAQPLVVNLGADLPQFSVAWPLLGVLALLTGLGVELVARAAPQLPTSGWVSRLSLGQRSIELAWPLWIIPALTPIAIFAFFRLFRGVLQTNAYLLVLVATFVLLLLVLSAQHYLIVGTPRAKQIARSILSVVAYVLAFGLFSAVAFAFNQYRALYAFGLVFPSVFLLSADLLRGRVQALWTTAAVIALLLIESYWVINYWPASYLLTSVTLLTIFYVVIGLAQYTMRFSGTKRAAGDDGLESRAIVEYGLLGVVLIVLIVVAINYLRARNIDLQLP